MTKITKAEFETLPDSLKAKFVADGDSYVLQEEDVEGLKKSKAEILAEKKQLAEKLADLEKFKNEHEAKQSEQEEAKQREAGEFAELEKKLRAKIKELEDAHAAERNEDREIIKAAKLKDLLVEKGVLADRAKYALPDVQDQFDLIKEGKEFSLKYKNGIGDANEIDGVFNGLKTSSPFLFAGTTQTGGGALGSGNNGGTQPDASSMTPTQKLESYYASGPKT